MAFSRREDERHPGDLKKERHMPKIVKQLTLVVVVALVARPALAADTPPLASLPQITNAAADSTKTNLVIDGKNFGTAAAPVVMLGGVKLGIPSTALSNLIVVALPPALPPASYPLWVQTFTSLSSGGGPVGLWSYISVTLGAVGPQG